MYLADAVLRRDSPPSKETAKYGVSILASPMMSYSSKAGIGRQLDVKIMESTKTPGLATYQVSMQQGPATTKEGANGFTWSGGKRKRLRFLDRGADDASDA